jgi:CRISPR system Cascade subunit CasE
VTRPLSLVRLQPEPTALVGWAVPRGYLNGVSDLGYALHAALKAALGEMAPQPFMVRERDRTIELLGYVAHPAEAVQEAAAVAAALGAVPPSVLNLARIEARTMPANWTAGRRWSFETRIRPVVRSRPAGRASRGQELDAALWQRLGAGPAEDLPEREAVYRQWLGERLAAKRAARLIAAEVLAMRSSTVLRRPIEGEKRAVRRIPGPDVTIRGELTVEDPAAFADLLAGGIGRHRAFGFGCLLLAPPGVW